MPEDNDTERAALLEAWEIVHWEGDTAVVLRHAFTCHADGSDCDGGDTCRPDATRQKMLDVAYDVMTDGAGEQGLFSVWWKVSGGFIS